MRRRIAVLLVGLLGNAAAAGCLPSKSQGGEETTVFNTLFRSNKKGGTYVEIGGLDGVTFSNTLMLHTCHRWSGLLVEASPANFAKMQQNVARLRPTASIAHGGVCPTTGNLTFEAFDDCTACSGAADAVKAYNAGKPSKKASSVHIVPCKPFSAYLAAAAISHVDFFSLDVEGHELKVIESIDFDAVTIDSFLVELNGLHPTKDATLRTHLRQHGFKECVGLMSRNSAFIRLNGPLKCPQHTAWWQIEMEELIEVTMKSLGGQGGGGNVVEHGTGEKHQSFTSNASHERDGHAPSASPSTAHQPLAVLIHTYDLVWDIVPLILTSVARYLPRSLNCDIAFRDSTCVWRLYFANEARPLEQELLDSLPVPVTQIRTGVRSSRSYDFVSSLLLAIDRLTENLVVWLQEDFFLPAPVSAAELLSLVTLARRANGGVTYVFGETSNICDRARPDLQDSQIRFGQAVNPRVYWYTHHGGMWQRQFLRDSLMVPSDGSSWSQETAFNVNRHPAHGKQLLQRGVYCATSKVGPTSGLALWCGFMHLGVVIEQKRALFMEMCRNLSLVPPSNIMHDNSTLGARVRKGFGHYVHPKLVAYDRPGGNLTMAQRAQLVAEREVLFAKLGQNVPKDVYRS